MTEFDGRGRTVLGIDTATVVCAGLAADGVLVASGQVDDRMAHVEQLTPLVRRLCRQAGIAPNQLTDVVVGLGPGPYTGLRVGIVTARVLAELAGARLHGICSLDAIAAQYATAGGPSGDFVVATDARRKEVYWARYAADGTRLDGPAVNRPSELPALPTVGPGADLYADGLPSVPGPRALDPATLAVVGPTLPDAGREPLYLRRPDAAEPGRRKSVLVRGARR
ncbi:MAG TPA: tRNA (adenosine(37)-N6)-threonylcarbamoyltransferase complex dimerization subunit type 1 TsaB [Microlunatus sp.]|jgi:tRNA threonylcarbamoyl adenosine modification protein YeaZ|nr:tRNA (adenosine(37)-N6)-threonylcarbamoyltransferase complex dimerization subunit type 1 TsaB [Microlunatus sp.]